MLEQLVLLVLLIVVVLLIMLVLLALLIPLVPLVPVSVFVYRICLVVARTVVFCRAYLTVLIVPCLLCLSLACLLTNVTTHVSCRMHIP